jgi:propanol-preferring alcohol dehydrogenase
MKAMQLDHVGPIESHPLHLREIETPKPGPGELVMKVAACGVCRSNLHTIEGDWVAGGVPSFTPIIPGHEVVGFAVGDYVGVQPLWSTDLTCEYCVSARDQLCPVKKVTGETIDGGYAEYMLANAAHTHHVPENLSPIEAAPLFCPGITAFRAVHRARLAPGQTVALFGMGGVGHMVVQFAKLAGADVVVVARGKRHRELGEELGAVGSIDASGPDLVGELKRRGIDAAINFAPSDQMLQAAMDGVKPGGIVVNGAAHNLRDIVFADEKSLVGSVIGNRDEMRTVLEIAAAGKVKVVAKQFALDEAEKALMQLKAGDIEARSVLVMA